MGRAREAGNMGSTNPHTHGPGNSTQTPPLTSPLTTPHSFPSLVTLMFYLGKNT